MKVNDPNLQGPSGLGSTGASRVTRTNSQTTPTGAPVSGDGKDGVELSGLAQALRSLDVDSPERQAKVDALARTYARGNYQVDAAATAGGIIDDALDHK
jgi:flagellar biosynthesis anti-sigma factor FlgM